MPLTIVKPGALASVQDLGRYGHRQRGICPGGALDTLALALANRLAGNPDGAAGIEITLGGCELRFGAATRIALAGTDFGAQLDGAALYPGWSVPVAPGQVLRLGRTPRAGTRAGVRSWLAVAGGIDVPLLLGSRSTDLKAGFGGHAGRALRRNDRLALGPSALSQAQRSQRAFGLRLPLPATQDDATVLRVLPGPEFDRFSAAARQALWRERWQITPQSNRMGSRLAGAVLTRAKGGGEMLSAGVIPGTIQVPPSGQPIILMGDAQTTGGYPRIGVVIRADQWALAQAPLGGWLRLQAVAEAAALAAWEQRQRWLAQVAQALAARGWGATVHS